MSTEAVTDSTFESDVIQSATPVLVDFWAEWCGPCKQLSPTLETLSDEMGDKVKIVKMNIDENPEQAAKFGIRSIPTMMIFKNGELVDQFTGAAPKAKIQNWINEVV